MAGFTIVVTMECVDVGLITLFKASTMKGMSYHVFIVYAYAIAAYVLLPAPFISHKSRVLPPLSFSILSKSGLLGLVGSSSQIVLYMGINYSSPTLASAISNLTPAFTFILAIIFSYLSFSQLLLIECPLVYFCWSTALWLATFIYASFCFLRLVPLYKGTPIFMAPSPFNTVDQPFHSPNQSWVLGGILLTSEYILVPLWYIVQTQIMKEAEFTVVFFYNLFVSMIAAVIDLVAEGTSSAWIIRPTIVLASVFCSGLYGSCLNNTVRTWALHLNGPVFVEMFKPLSIVIAAIIVMGVMLLGDSLYLGSLIGVTTISIGFYTVIWVKNQRS